VIFGRNDLVQDAPISRIDLLVCRNTLMYFNAETRPGF
jgi:two-component system CheB/CheR fusion protein